MSLIVKPVKEINVTIIPLIKTPKIIPITLRVLDIERRYAAKEPVHTPVKGNGIPINNINPIDLYLLILFDELYVLFMI